MTDLIRKSDALAAVNAVFNGYPNHASDAIAALPAVTVGIKPLVWFEAELPSRGGGKYTAEGYTIRKIEGLWLLDFAGQGRSKWRWTELDAAKAAAQADYEARIMAALEPVAAPVTQDKFSAVDHMSRVADTWMHKAEGLQREIDMLSDPVIVHANMLRGAIAKPTVEQIIHLYGVDALTKALAPVIVREAALDDLARLGQEYDAAPDPAAIREAALREAAEAINERGAREQEDFGLTRATQNFFRARDLVRSLITKGAADDRA